jgi:hypothetical protein
VPTDGVELDHMPPVTVFANVTTEPVQTLDGPIMAGGTAKTITATKALQPVGRV